MYSSKDISVVIPAFNAEHTIIRALRSVFRQIATPGDVIVVDDGSTDRTVSLIRGSRFATKVTVISQVNSGPAAARNTGIGHSNKPWIAFLDADDLWIDQNKLVDQMALVNRYADACLIDSYARVSWSGVRESVIDRDKAGDVFERLLFSNIINATSSVLARRDAMLSVGGFDTALRLGEDRLMWAQLARQGSVYTLPKVTLTKFNEPGNLTSKGEKNYPFRLQLVEKLLALSTRPAHQHGPVWMANLSEFLRLAVKSNNIQHFLQVFSDALRLCPRQVMVSKYLPLAAYAKLVGNFELVAGKQASLQKRRAA